MADYAWKLKGNRLSPVPAFFRHFSTVNCCPQLISPPVVALTTEGGQIERERENERDRERKRGLHVPRRPTTAIKVTLIAMTVNSQRISLRAAWRPLKISLKSFLHANELQLPWKTGVPLIRPSYLRVKPVFLNVGRIPRKGNSNNFGKQLKKWCCHWYNNNNNKKWLTIVIDVGEALKWNMTQKKLGNIRWDADSMRHFVISQCFYFFDNCLDFTGLQLKRIKMNKIIEICTTF